MIDVFELQREEFMTELSKRTTPRQVFDNAPVIYEYMTEVFEQSCMDSLLREWAFDWASTRLRVPYDTIYNRWIRG